MLPQSVNLMGSSEAEMALQSCSELRWRGQRQAFLPTRGLQDAPGEGQALGGVGAHQSRAISTEGLSRGQAAANTLSRS